MRIQTGTPPWAPSEGVGSEEVWHFWDHPRWGYFEVAGERFAFHRHDTVGDFNDGPSLWTYRRLDDQSLAELSLPVEQWGAQWARVYEAWRARTPASWWAIADDDLAVVRFGALDPPVIDDDTWAKDFWT